MTTLAGMTGFAPSVQIKPIPPKMSEQEKYLKLWQDPRYRAVAPGEQLAQMFLQQARPPADAEVIDFGCGTGRGALMLALFGRLRVKMLDFAENCLDEDVAQGLRVAADANQLQAARPDRPLADVAAVRLLLRRDGAHPDGGRAEGAANILGERRARLLQHLDRPDVMGATIGEDAAPDGQAARMVGRADQGRRRGRPLVEDARRLLPHLLLALA
jgi:hypothetical protein